MLRKVPDISDCRIGQTYACTYIQSTISDYQYPKNVTSVLG